MRHGYRRSALTRYGAAAVTVGIAVLIRLAIVPVVEHETPFLLFFAAVLLSAWYGGLGPSLFATVLAALASNYFFMYPYYRLELNDPVQRVRLLLFLGEGVVVSALSAALHNAKCRADASADHARMLQRKILDVSESEMRRIGRDLHDGLGQLLTGIAFMSRALSRQVSDRSPDDAADARRIEQHVNRAVGWTRDLAAGLAPVAIESQGLAPALRQLAAQATEIFGIRCEFDGHAGAPGDLSLAASDATHLYRIAQEAISNAAKHARARHVWVRLGAVGEDVRLAVEDDGIGTGAAAASAGMGIQTMSDRARMIGGTFRLNRTNRGGTAVVCSCPARAASAAALAGEGNVA